MFARKVNILYDQLFTHISCNKEHVKISTHSPYLYYKAFVFFQTISKDYPVYLDFFSKNKNLNIRNHCSMYTRTS